MRILKVVYVIAIAVFLILLVVLGVQAFYPGPQSPNCYETLGPYPAYNSTEYDDWNQACQQLWEEYRQESAAHNRNIFFVVLPLGAVLAVAGTFIRHRLDVFGAGLILGGMGTMVFSIAPYNLDNVLRFVGIAVALAVLLFVGYKVFLSSRKS